MYLIVCAGQIAGSGETQLRAICDFIARHGQDAQFSEMCAGAALVSIDAAAGAGLSLAAILAHVASKGVIMGGWK